MAQELKILVINGPNLNLLGKREPDVYGNQSFEDYFSKLQFQFKETELSYFQSNSEGDLITKIQDADGVFDGIVLNAAAYTHTSVGIGDAIAAVSVPVIEVHISQVHKREAFRHHSYVSLRADGVIAGLGLEGYAAAVRRVCQLARQAG